MRQAIALPQGSANNFFREHLPGVNAGGLSPPGVPEPVRIQILAQRHGAASNSRFNVFQI